MRSLFVLVALSAAISCSQEQPALSTPSVATRSAFAAGVPPSTPGPLPGGNGALGSGCAPGAGPLPDGAWYGYAVAWDSTGIEFDLACFYVGAAAAAQASARNDESPPNDFYLVNDDTTTRRVNVAADTVTYRLTSSEGPVGLEPTSYSGLVTNPGPPGIAPCPGEWCAMWVFINDGRVTEAMQQYIP